MKYPLILAGSTHQGLVRENNEDRFLIDQGLGLCIVADGMGGHQAGEIASQIAVEKIAGRLAMANSLKLEAGLRSAFKKAHQAIQKASQTRLELRGMGSTAVTFWMPAASETIGLAHVGDSRAYLLRAGELIGLTEDHTVYNQARRSGLLGPDESRHPSRSLLSQALGASAVIAPEIAVLEPQSGDRFLLCSDGLTDMLDDAEIHEYLMRPAGPQAACEILVQAALQKGGRDNVTVIILHFLSSSEGL